MEMWDKFESIRKRIPSISYDLPCNFPALLLGHFCSLHDLLPSSSPVTIQSMVLQSVG
jgi:hypothetical protein